MKLSFKLLFLFLISTALTGLLSADVLLAPAERGKKSKVIQNTEIEKMMEEKDRTMYKMYYNMGGDTASHYTWTACQSKFADTFMVWFDPPAICSLMSYRVYVHNYFDSLNTHEVTIFCAELDTTIDYYDDFNGANWLADPCTDPYPYSPIDSIISEKTFTLQGGNWYVFNLWDTLAVPHDFKKRIFGVGFYKNNPADSCPNPAFWINFSGASLPTHSILHGDTACTSHPGWYIWYSAAYGAPFCMFANVDLYTTSELALGYERLPDTYSQDSRRVNIHSHYLCPSQTEEGVKEIFLNYKVNSGSTDEISCSMSHGDSLDGYWYVDIPGNNPGDTIVYWFKGIEYEGDTVLSQTSTYIIRAGDPGDFLYVRDDYAMFDGGDIAAILPDYYEDTVDVWDTKIMGQPDSSVFAYYTYGAGSNCIVWRSWGVEAFTDVDYGLGHDSTDLNYPDSNYLKAFLDNNGGFWLSDQDMGAGLGICPDFGHGNVTGWVRNYLGAQGMYDDDAQLDSICITAYSAGNPVIDDLFSGPGYQNAGQVYIAPYSYFDPTMAASFTGSYDSLMSGTVQNMFDVNGRIFSYAWEGPSDEYRVWMDFWAWDYIVNPADSTHLDTVAVDTYVFDVLDWVCPCGFIERDDNPINPEKITHLFSIQPVTDKALIQYFLPEKTPISLDVYDLSGRKIKNLINRTGEPGLNTYIWNCRDSEDKRIPAGIYFIHLTTEDKKLTQKMVLVR